jgi:hypothetical protein
MTKENNITTVIVIGAGASKDFRARQGIKEAEDIFQDATK